MKILSNSFWTQGSDLISLSPPLRLCNDLLNLSKSAGTANPFSSVADNFSSCFRAMRLIILPSRKKSGMTDLVGRVQKMFISTSALLGSSIDNDRSLQCTICMWITFAMQKHISSMSIWASVERRADESQLTPNSGFSKSITGMSSSSAQVDGDDINDKFPLLFSSSSRLSYFESRASKRLIFSQAQFNSSRNCFTSCYALISSLSNRIRLCLSSGTGTTIGFGSVCSAGCERLAQAAAAVIKGSAFLLAFGFLVPPESHTRLILSSIV